MIEETKPGIVPTADVEVRPTTAADTFFLINQQALVNSSLMSALLSCIEGDKATASKELRAAYDHNLKLGRRIDALVRDGSSRVD